MFSTSLMPLVVFIPIVQAGMVCTAFAKPAKGLFLGDLCRQWAVVCGWKCNVFSRIFNIVSAFFVVEWMSGGKKSILARVVFGTKWGFVHN